MECVKTTYNGSGGSSMSNDAVEELIFNLMSITKDIQGTCVGG